jgi:cholesterol transport system auxiliary component
MKPTRAFLPWILLPALLVSGCTLVPERAALDRAWFLLEVPEGAVSEGEPVRVELASVRIAPELAGKGLVYRPAPYRYESDFYNEWFLNPREHVEQVLRERWTRASAPVNLVPDAGVGTGALRLDVLVTALHGDLQADGPGVARAGLRVFVQGPGWTELWNLEQSKPMANRTPVALVSALSESVAALLEDLERRLRTTQETQDARDS